MAHQFECEEPDCEFLVRSRSNEEVIQLARAHVRDAHGGRVESADIDGVIERADAA
ncbi:DUF1059 domain-containing protein [Natronoglomus mannanivorans]|uniref:DUF1059 domain-containing protein n=1 Tax=Natronoglomus mannanivorans TaxID=2979990 RepID=A0AAP2Z2G6_9EURY|nr:DUF1059 domain-containing protein [Halobacteria archaeon AArc-xg1-1]